MNRRAYFFGYRVGAKRGYWRGFLGGFVLGCALVLGVLLAACDGEQECVCEDPEVVIGECEWIAYCVQRPGMDLRYCASAMGNVALMELADQDELAAYHALVECVVEELNEQGR